MPLLPRYGCRNLLASADLHGIVIHHLVLLTGEMIPERPDTMIRSKAALKMLAVLLLLVLCGLCAAAQADTVSPAGLNEAMKYLKKNKPSELTIESGRFKPSELIQVKNALPEGAEFHFTVTWGGVSWSDTTTELDLTGLKGAVTKAELEAVISLCPDIKYINNSAKRYPTNDDMIELIDKYPNIQFDWIVSFGKGHYCPTNATTFSTMNPPSSGKELTSQKMELLKYVPHLKALDLGHNKLTTLDFLQYVPELELLIIGQNEVKDITPIGQLKNLQYAELFTNPFTDLSPLAYCLELLDLNITNCKAPDLSPLDGLQKLERLWANMIKGLTDEEKERFKSVHPNCQVDFQPSHAATVDGWRKHIRYKHYIWCFKNHKWYSFNEEIPGVKLEVK